MVYRSEIYSSERNRKKRRNRKTLKEEPPERKRVFYESLKSTMKEYCLESSICGLKRLVDNDGTFIERVVWVGVMMVSVVCSGLLVNQTFVQYYSAPLVTTQLPEGIPVSDIAFPAVAICTTNRISKTRVTSFAETIIAEGKNQKKSLTELLELFENLGHIYDLKSPVNESSMNDLHIIIQDYDLDVLMRDLTPRCEDLLTLCMWNTVVQNCSRLFDTRLTMNGYCCTFNYLRTSDDFNDSSLDNMSIDMYTRGNKTLFKEGYGLHAIIKLNTDDDFYYNVPLQGAQLTFSDPFDFPDAPSGSFRNHVVSPNYSMQVLVTATVTDASRDIEHIPVALRGCLFYDESPYLKMYTHSDCLLKCRMLFLLQVCNCTPFTMPNIGGSRNCGLQDIQCLKKFYTQSISIKPRVQTPELELELVGGGISCDMCYPACSKTTYFFQFYDVQLHADYMNALSDDERPAWLTRHVPPMVREMGYGPGEAMNTSAENHGYTVTAGDTMRGVNFSGESILHIKYRNDVADCVYQNMIMKWFDVVSNIGSTCGFVTGFSFVSLIEFIYFFTIKLAERYKLEKSESNTLEEADSITRPFYLGEFKKPESKRHAQDMPMPIRRF